jgi:dihydropteroate synthase
VKATLTSSLDLEVDGPVLMGVVNATVDSFSDAGRYPDLASRLELADRLVADGAGVIDVGGQSAITSVPETAPEVEAAAVVPIVEHLRAAHPSVVVSVDTYKPAVAEAVLAAGAHVVNDISGARDPGVVEQVLAHGAGYVLMHNLSRPKQRLTDPHLYGDVVEDVVRWFDERLAALEALGLPREAVILDPGPDFAKTPHQTVEILRHLDALDRFGRPVLAAVSKKDFVGTVLQRPPTERLAGTLGAVAALRGHRHLIYRVHDVAAVADFLAVVDVLEGRRPLAEDAELAPELRRSAPPPAR